MQVNQLVSSLLSGVRSRASSSLQPLADDSIQELFQSLDQDANGQISFEEFKGTSVQSWAAMHTIATSMPSVNTVLSDHIPPLPAYDAPLSSWCYTWLYYLVVVQCVLAFVEHIRYWLGLRCLRTQNPGSRFTTVDLTSAPTHVSNQEAVPWHDTPSNTCYARFKVVLMVTSGLAPLRLVQGIALFIGAVVGLNIANIVPFKLWRRCWLAVVRVEIYLMLASMGYYKIPITGSFAPPDQVKLLMANHVSLLEVIIMFAESFPSFVSRIENLSIPYVCVVVFVVGFFVLISIQT